jgi:hypothetical protein
LVAHFQRQQQQQGLHTVESAVHEVTQEEVVGVGTVATCERRDRGVRGKKGERETRCERMKEVIGACIGAG